MTITPHVFVLRLVRSSDVCMAKLLLGEGANAKAQAGDQPVYNRDSGLLAYSLGALLFLLIGAAAMIAILYFVRKQRGRRFADPAPPASGGSSPTSQYPASTTRDDAFLSYGLDRESLDSIIWIPVLRFYSGKNAL